MTDKDESKGPGFLFKLALMVILLIAPAVVNYYILMGTGMVPPHWIGTPLIISVALLFGGACHLVISNNYRYYLYSVILTLAISIGTVGVYLRING